MEIKSTLKVIQAARLKGEEGVIPEQNMKRIIGCPEVPSDSPCIG